MTWSAAFSWDADAWRAEAACRRAGLELFFPVGVTDLAFDQIDAAKAICASCAVREPCLAFALDTDQEAGVWGGLDEDERRRLRRRSRTTRRPPPRPGAG
ncbi:MAG TPA: WhiB family transcriptional regulator [Jatrophihabitans sp.]|nr:WhiB family transcriptional regulator [Jatrophihabitans sp.]